MDLKILAIIGSAVIGTAALAAIQSVYWTYTAREEAKHRELARRLGAISEDQAESLFRERARDAAAEALGRTGRHLRETILAADSEMTVGTLVGRMALFGVVPAVLGMVLFGVTGALLLIFGLIPYFLLRRQGQARQRALLNQLPDALDLMARSMQAGLGLSDAFRLAAEEMPLPLAAEFGRVFEEVRLGRDYRDALTNLLQRNHAVFDLRLFVSSVLLQRETGGNLIEILDNIANTIRSRFLFHAKVKALTSEATFSAYILGALPFSVTGLIFVVNPEYLLPLITDPFGNLMLLYIFGSYSFGIFLMREVSKVEV